MEFLYTRQQMEGFKGYQSKVKIGNWSEDMELEAAKLKDYLMKKERGLLKCSQVGRGCCALLSPRARARAAPQRGRGQSRAVLAAVHTRPRRAQPPPVAAPPSPPAAAPRGPGLEALHPDPASHPLCARPERTRAHAGACVALLYPPRACAAAGGAPADMDAGSCRRRSDLRTRCRLWRWMRRARTAMCTLATP